MAPPPMPTSPSLNILPSNQSAVNHVSPPLASPNMTSTTTVMGDNTGVGTGPGPLRHPRPLTAADLHLQLEKEQEAVVNRLTRELTMLRAAQNASVVSNTSSTSAGFPDPADHNANHLLSGPSHPAPSQRRHHRSSSSTSTRSNTAIASLTGLTTAPSTTADRTRGSLPRHDSNTQPASISLSRQNSTTGSRRSGASSPAPLSSAQSSYQPHPGDHFPSYYTSRPIPHRDPSSSSLAMMSGGSEMARQDSITSLQTTGRYEEAAFHRHELEAVKRENEALRRRVRDLERTLRQRRQSDASVGRGRSESVSTTASVRDRELGGAGRGREREVGEEEVVQVGESARSAGL
ncbi:uncharacterized protein LY89DRAFT_578410 [Mollisia scopiformis]|uniref:Uncharacterized protein n=1 Tax=Mollisia scopiformis TaxID=149040 RepID=A0A194XKJ5_MOLSC|nr:uncharacterized protein LY89DRAFT_578410 [Mollisia scopiformis]KUJ20735.1 hypothetical protein LY89DRAFT_578410 [Mollisia scopiformis]